MPPTHFGGQNLQPFPQRTSQRQNGPQGSSNLPRTISASYLPAALVHRVGPRPALLGWPAPGRPRAASPARAHGRGGVRVPVDRPPLRGALPRRPAGPGALPRLHRAGQGEAQGTPGIMLWGVSVLCEDEARFGASFWGCNRCEVRSLHTASFPFWVGSYQEVAECNVPQCLSPTNPVTLTKACAYRVSLQSALILVTRSCKTALGQTLQTVEVQTSLRCS